jgi:hypothetical protein
VPSRAATFIASQIESSCNQPASSSCAKALANVDLPDPAEPAIRNSRRVTRVVLRGAARRCRRSCQVVAVGDLVADRSHVARLHVQAGAGHPDSIACEAGRWPVETGMCLPLTDSSPGETNHLTTRSETAAKPDTHDLEKEKQMGKIGLS